MQTHPTPWTSRLFHSRFPSGYGSQASRKGLIVCVFYNEREEMSWHSVFYGPGAGIELKSVDAHLTIQEVYKGIDFDEPLVGE